MGDELWLKVVPVILSAVVRSSSPFCQQLPCRKNPPRKGGFSCTSRIRFQPRMRNCCLKLNDFPPLFDLTVRIFVIFFMLGVDLRINLRNHFLEANIFLLPPLLQNRLVTTPLHFLLILFGSDTHQTDLVRVWTSGTAPEDFLTPRPDLARCALWSKTDTGIARSVRPARGKRRGLFQRVCPDNPRPQADAEAECGMLGGTQEACEARESRRSHGQCVQPRSRSEVASRGMETVPTDVSKSRSKCLDLGNCVWPKNYSTCSEGQESKECKL